MAESTWPTVRQLTDFPKEVLKSKLSEIREIRNVIGHSRAIGGRAELLVTAAASALVTGIEKFKTNLLYAEPLEVHIGHPEEYEAKSVPARFAEMTANNDWSTFQPMLSEGKYFFSLTRLPVEPFSHFVGVRSLLTRCGSIYNDLLAIMVNKVGDELTTLVWPKQAKVEVHERVLNFFFENHNRIWVEVPYPEQAPAAICDPAIWFYENERPQQI